MSVKEANFIVFVEIVKFVHNSQGRINTFDG